MMPQAAESTSYGIVREVCFFSKLSPYKWHLMTSRGEMRASVSLVFVVVVIIRLVVGGRSGNPLNPFKGDNLKAEQVLLGIPRVYNIWPATGHTLWCHGEDFELGLFLWYLLAT